VIPGQRRCRAGWLLAGLAAIAAPAQALQLQSDAAALAPPEAARSHQLLDEASRLLPPRWSDALGTVRVEWRDDLPADVHGRAFGNRIVLRRALLDDAGDRPALAAIVHELAHLYDRGTHDGLSRDPRLRELAGWQDAPLRPWRTHNAFTDRSPDRYELASPAEYVAVNLEHFLLDADYACRRPALFRHFAASFGKAPDHAACPADLPFVQAAQDDSTPLLALDPARIYAVDYLLAEGNDRPMSHWGHGMLRLVVCAPGRAPGPDCRLDVGYHQVLSFRAFVDDVQISSWRGLTGTYPSRLFVLPFTQVVDEYTKGELRGLRSIPLRLQPAEITTLLQRAAQLHWSYDGRYRFIGNNCAVETARLLADGVPSLRDAGLMSITPTGLLRRLQRAGIADPHVLDDRAEASRLGYYFEPASARYQAMFDVARKSLELPQRGLEQWLALPPAQRAVVIPHADLRASAALLLLEQASLQRQELEARDVLKHRLLAPRRDAARAVLQLEDMLTRPARLLADGSGYGLPQRTEREAATHEGQVLATRWRQQRDTLLARARDWLPAPTRDALAATEANIAALGTRLRDLNASRGGLRID
jgi:hypothetical protein